MLIGSAYVRWARVSIFNALIQLGDEPHLAAVLEGAVIAAEGPITLVSCLLLLSRRQVLYLCWAKYPFHNDSAKNFQKGMYIH